MPVLEPSAEFRKGVWDRIVIASNTSGSVGNYDAVLGISPGDTDLGVFSGSTLPDNSSVRAVLQVIETILEGAGGILNNFGATLAPAVTDDSVAGYQVGSRWIDTTNDNAYVCVDATAGAAVWVQTNLAGGGGSSVTLLQNNYAAVAAPSATDDSAAGYGVGSEWIDVTSDTAYVCVDATPGAAVWVQTNSTSSLVPVEVSANTFVSAGGEYWCRTDGAAITLSLPAAPAEGAVVWAFRKGANSVTIAGNGATILGDATLILDIDKAGVKLVYFGGDWSVAFAAAL